MRLCFSNAKVGMKIYSGVFNGVGVIESVGETILIKWPEGRVHYHNIIQFRVYQLYFHPKYRLLTSVII